MRLNKKITIALASMILLSPAMAFAAAEVAEDTKSNYNLGVISLVSLMLVLLLVIAVLGNTLRQLSFVVRDKNRKERKEAGGNKAKTTILVLLLSLPALHSFAADAAAKAALAPEAPNYIHGLSNGDFYALIGMIAFEIIVIFALSTYIRILIGIIRSNAEAEAAAAGEKVEKRSWFWDSFNKAASLEHEKDVLMDHNYDGIQELDNSLPPWWKYGFYLTIIVGVIYLYRFHISHDGPSSREEYLAEMKKGEEDKAAYLSKSANNVDENNVTQLTDPAEIAEGKAIFVKTCAPCHLADGGGMVGPNLTDEYWLHGGGIKDIFKSIKYGWQDKGMKSWKDDFSPKQIQQLASFVKSLKGTKPATPKAPQGDIYIEAGPAAGGAADSTKAKTDTTKASDAQVKKK